MTEFIAAAQLSFIRHAQLTLAYHAYFKVKMIWFSTIVESLKMSLKMQHNHHLCF